VPKQRVLWLCSWYPNETDAFRGDFIERQAQAVQPYADIEILHFVPYSSKDKIESKLQNGVQVHIHYSSISNRWLSFLDMWRWHIVFLKEYIERKGHPDFVHVHVPWKAGIIAKRWKKMHNIPYLITEHYGIYNKVLKNNYFKRSRRFKTRLKKIFKGAEIVLPVSEQLGKEINDIVPIVYRPVSNVVDTSLFNFRNIKFSEPFQFIHVSGMDENKRPGLIIEAFEKLYETNKNILLTLVGEAPEHLKQQAAHLVELGAVQFKGTLTYVQTAQALKEAHCFVLFSGWESQSCVVLEALCSGRPVISSRVGGTIELISPQNGLLVQSGNVLELSNAMESIIDHFEQYNLEQIAKDAKEKYAYEVIGREIAAVYQALVNQAEKA